MDRSRSKRYYYPYDDCDYDSETLPPPRTRQRFHHSHGGGHHYYYPNNDNKDYNHHQYRSSAAAVPSKPFDPAIMVTTSYRILCHDARAGGVIGKTGSIIRAIRQHTGARINVHDLVSGDHEHIIEISDTRRRNPEGRMPTFSPSQEALLLIHERILKCDGGNGNTGGGGRGYNTNNYNNNDDSGSEDGEFRGVVAGNYYKNNGNRVTTRLVVSRQHVGSLLGRGGKIIEQMRIKSKAHIRVLTREHVLPRCVASSEEIVQVAGDVDSVKKAVEIISLRLRESQHRDRSQFCARQFSPKRFVAVDDDFIPQRSSRRSSTSMDGVIYESNLSAGLTSNRSSKYSSCSSGYAIESSNTPVTEDGEYFSAAVLVFRILCPVGKVNTVVGEPDGIMELLQNEIGVDVRVDDQKVGSDEQVIIISSDEGPDDELFPAQEALLHIQTRIVDLVPEKENIITTRLLVQLDEVGHLGGRDGLSFEMKKITGATVEILPREELPVCASESNQIVQIVGEIKAAREALIEVTSRLRSCAYGDIFQEETPQLPIPASSPIRSDMRTEATSDHNITPSQTNYIGSDSTTSSHQNSPDAGRVQCPKVHLFDLNSFAEAEEMDCPFDTGASGSEEMRQSENENPEYMKNRMSLPLVTRSTLEVAIPPHAASKLITKSRNKLAQISELSGANIELIEDRREETEKIIQISGTPERAERAQSLLQGFILSTQEDSP